MLSTPSRGHQPFLRLSKFSNVSPTICFYTKGTKGNFTVFMIKNIKKFILVRKPPNKWISKLNWCHNSLLPLVMRHSLAASHFKIVDETSKWIGYWGRHLKSSQYRKIKPFQKVFKKFYFFKKIAFFRLTIIRVLFIWVAKIDFGSIWKKWCKNTKASLFRLCLLPIFCLKIRRNCALIWMQFLEDMSFLNRYVYRNGWKILNEDNN